MSSIGLSQSARGMVSAVSVALVGMSVMAAWHVRLLSHALPGVAGAYVGLRVFHQLTDVQFQRLVNLALIVSGIALALK